MSRKRMKTQAEKVTRHDLADFLCQRCKKPDAEIQGLMVSHPKGRWVSHDDYLKLDELCRKLMKQHSDISCKNIKLRKAGDAVCESPYLLETDPAVIAWRASKEGKPTVSNWQPIETAPKDMSKVLGYCDYGVVVMCWFTYSNGRACWETVEAESEVDPTHWMPLPNPPAAKEGRPNE